MNEQDQKSLYTAFVLLGLLMSGAPRNAVPEMTKSIVDQVMKDDE
jgi:hypothetical protein